MHHDNYSIEFDEWVRYEQEIKRRGLRSKPFVGDRPYRHFDGRIRLQDLDTNQAKVTPFLKDPAKLKFYSFLPFLRKDKKVRRFTRDYNPETDKKEVLIKQKLRPIMYASHKDSCVYGFYAYMLKARHNELVKNLGIQHSVLAYRKIPREDEPDRNKSNIDFAKDVYTAVQLLDNAAIMCVDVKDFFGSMEHKKIRAKWTELLGADKLPIGHEVVFKNITRYHYLFLYEVMAVLGLGKLTKGKWFYNRNAKRFGMISTPKLFNKIVNNSSFIHENRTPRGIPQGSPISDIIANFYLLDFDVALSDYLSKNLLSIYKRYSDDILIVCPKEDAVATYKQVKQLLIAEGLKLNEKKTELFFVERKGNGLIDSTGLLVPDYKKNKTTVQYLGFEFDLNDMHIRSGTIANHYRKIVQKLKAAVSKNKSEAATKRHNKKKRDRMAYINLAAKKLESPRVNRQRANIRKRTTKLRRKNS